MPYTQYIKKFIRDLLVIFALIIIVSTIVNDFYFDREFYTFDNIYTGLLFALLGGIPSLIFYFANDFSTRAILIRRWVHFFSVEFLILLCSIYFGLIQSLQDAIIVAVEVLIIYVVVSLVAWTNAFRLTTKINE